MLGRQVAELPDLLLLPLITPSTVTAVSAAVVKKLDKSFRILPNLVFFGLRLHGSWERGMGQGYNERTSGLQEIDLIERAGVHGGPLCGFGVGFFLFGDKKNQGSQQGHASYSRPGHHGRSSGLLFGGSVGDACAEAPS
ncbi:MAG: hypothetical protein U5K69_13145 [Balneolaceae bacterium]|nr:hypothetical protein [Balneolaceae bacterium]